MADGNVGEILTANDHQSTVRPAVAVDVMNHTWLVALFALLYAAVFLLGLTGNLTVIYVVATRRRVRTSCRNVLIGNLAGADVLLCLLAVPFTPLSGMLRTWPFGGTLCHAVPMALGVGVYVSTLTVLAIAVDRYFVIVRHFQLRVTKSVCLLIIVIIWVISVAVSTPLAVHQKVATLVSSSHLPIILITVTITTLTTLYRSKLPLRLIKVKRVK